MKKWHILPFCFILLVTVLGFRLFFFQGKLPIPADTIVGLYHPFRDLYQKQFPRGVPFKNFLITDPVRQQYPWRFLSVDALKDGIIPQWNPYAMAGVPLLANTQSAAYYPLNIIFGFMAFPYAWSFLVILQPILSAIFLYLYLRFMRAARYAALLGGVVFAFSGFSISWMQWNTIGHVALWLPLILLAIDKNLLTFQKVENSKLQFKIKNYFVWPTIFVVSLASSFFAGHLQTFFYLILVSEVYFIARWFQFGKQKNILILFLMLNALFIILTSVQWMPTLQLIGESARNLDQIDWQKDEWFIPWQHLIQFLTPDFFGNPTTLNYWGVWNYAEFLGYVGIIPLILALFAVFFRRDKKTLFFTAVLALSFLFATPNIIASLPFIFHLPFISTAQPTRLLFLIDFSLAVLAAFGLDYFLKHNKGIRLILAGVGCIFAVLWAFILLLGQNLTPENLLVAKRNMYLPTALFGIAIMLFIAQQKIKKRQIRTTLIIFLLVISFFDLLRQSDKFLSFTKKEYLFPKTKIITFLQTNLGVNRFMTTDSRIFPPNFPVYYKLQSIDGYDPLYLLRYAEFAAASERNNPNISPPFGFNRIVTPRYYSSPLINLLGVKYILSLSDLSHTYLKKVFQEGETRVYENSRVLPRAFFVSAFRFANDKNSAIEILFDPNFQPLQTAVIENNAIIPYGKISKGKAVITVYNDNVVIIETNNTQAGFLVLTDTYYPTWHAKITSQDSRVETQAKIYRTNYLFRGVFVPSGKQQIKFYQSFF